MQHSKSTSIIVAFIVLVPLLAKAQAPPAASAEELAKKLANPVASLISAPFQNNTDYGIGPHNGSKNTLNIQPVIPIKVSPRINLIARVILPVVSQRDVSGENKNEDGLSDMTATAFFAPSNSKNGLIWALGPAFLVPTGTNDYLTTKKWGVGPSALLLKQAKGFTIGFLVNQIWSFAGSEERPDVNQMFLQPFLVHNWKSGAGLGVNAEITQNWEAGNGIAFINPFLSGVTKLGSQTVSLSVGPRIPVSGPAASEPDFGFRAVLTLVFPK
jgi:hypothetical protein